MSENKKAPLEVIKGGRGILASIWENTSDKGTFYKVSIKACYKNDKGEFKNPSSFSQQQLLNVARVSQLAYDRVEELRAANYQNAASAPESAEATVAAEAA